MVLSQHFINRIPQGLFRYNKLIEKRYTSSFDKGDTLPLYER
jgi:hypothetical protein